jgi:hypothetical protein
LAQSPRDGRAGKGIEGTCGGGYAGSSGRLLFRGVQESLYCAQILEEGYCLQSMLPEERRQLFAIALYLDMLFLVEDRI